MIDPLNKLCKWRSVLAGWHMGSAPDTKPGVRAMRDLMDKFLMARVESSALAELLIKKGVFTHEEFTKAIYREADHLDKIYERLFPGFRTSADGVVIYDQDMAKKTMADLGFPP